MGLRSETRAIDGLEVTVTQFAALRGFGLLTKLGKILAPALGKAQGVSMTDDLSALGPALAELFARLDAADAQGLAKELLCSTTVITEGKQVPLDRAETIDLVFGGRLKTMLEVLKFVLEVNYSDFFAGALAGAPAEPGGESASRSPTILPRRGRRGGSG